MFNRRHFTSLLGSLAATGSMAGSGPAPDHAVKRLHPGEDEASLLGVELNRLSSPAAKRLRIGFGSCAKQSKPQPIWTHIRQQKPELFLFMGDNFYADARTEETLKARYEEFRAVSALQRFRDDVPHLATWDDHDFGDDDVGGEYALKALSQQLFCDEWKEPPQSPRRSRQGIYQAYWLNSGGRRVQVLMLDLRFNRTPLVADPAKHSGYHEMVKRAQETGGEMAGWYVPNPDPLATMLGEAQWAWLSYQLQQPADLRILVSSVQLAAEGTGWEGWSNFPHDRQRLLALIRQHRADGLVVLSGDMHYADISCWTEGAPYPIWDATSSGLTEVWPIPTPNRQRRSKVLADRNFGMLDIDWTGRDPVVAMNIHDGQGQLRLSQTLRLSQLRCPSPADREARRT